MIVEFNTAVDQRHRRDDHRQISFADVRTGTQTRAGVTYTRQITEQQQFSFECQFIHRGTRQGVEVVAHHAISHTRFVIEFNLAEAAFDHRDFHCAIFDILRRQISARHHIPAFAVVA